ncbi:unnamed protein product [Symbiodinium sp. KB8]|nr:unnamed protein product [Symbiodinium sp. KB8]
MTIDIFIIFGIIIILIIFILPAILLRIILIILLCTLLVLVQGWYITGQTLSSVCSTTQNATWCPQQPATRLSPGGLHGPFCTMRRVCRASAAATMLQGGAKHAGIGGAVEGLPPRPVGCPCHRPVRGLGMQEFLQAHVALIAAACTTRRRITAAGSARASFAVPLLDLAQSQRSEASTGTPFLDAFRGIGAFQVRVPAPLARDTQHVFEHFETFMSLPEAARHRFLCDPGEVLVVHGYQPRGGEAERFNRFRSGIVFHGKSTLPLLPEPFEVDIQRWRDRMWRLSERILEQLRDELCRSGKMEVNLGMGSFSEGAAVDMISGSHFQLKQMHSGSEPKGSGSGETVRLPLHQDPSFMSLLIHGSSDPPGQGLEIWDEAAKEFVAVPRSGCEVATVFIGQLFHLLCGRGDMRFAKGAHRVVTRAADLEKQRLTAVFFFQPQLDTLLIPFVAPAKGKQEEPISFRERRLRSYRRFARAAPPWKKESG